jgi:UDP-glucose 6-dehydrogenase
MGPVTLSAPLIPPLTNSIAAPCPVFRGNELGRATLVGFPRRFFHSDDERDSSALDVAEQLRGLDTDVVATDPQGIENSRLRHPQLIYSTSIEETLRGADAVVLVNEWAEFKEIDPVWAATLVRVPIIIDAHNTLDAAAWRAAS